MSECTCAKQTFLHLADCPMITPKKRSLDYVYEQAMKSPTSIIFYIVDSIDESKKQMNFFMGKLKDSDWYFQQEAKGVCSVVFTNGSEVTFLPESETMLLLEMPTSSRIFIEGSNASRDIGEMLVPKTNGISFVDPQTKELI